MEKLLMARKRNICHLQSKQLSNYNRRLLETHNSLNSTVFFAEDGEKVITLAPLMAIFYVAGGHVEAVSIATLLLDSINYMKWLIELIICICTFAHMIT